MTFRAILPNPSYDMLLISYQRKLCCLSAGGAKNLTHNLDDILDLKALDEFRSGREYHHVKYVKNRERQRNYLILLKKDPVMEIQLCGQTLIMLL